MLRVSPHMLPVSSRPVLLNDVFLVHLALLCPARLPLCQKHYWGHSVPFPLPCATLLPTAPAKGCWQMGRA